MADSNPATPQRQTFYDADAELADLGTARAEHDTAAVGDRDYSLYAHTPVTVIAGRAPRGKEGQVHAWNTFQFTTEERDDREELKGDLHEGQLHRHNRMAAERERMGGPIGMGFGSGGGGGSARARGGRGQQQDGQVPALVAGMKPPGKAVPPLAKGFAEELDKSMFWDEPIVPK